MTDSRGVTADIGDVLPGINAGASTFAVPSPIEGSGTAWVLLGSWALSPARPTPIHPRHECRGFSALLVTWLFIAVSVAVTLLAHVPAWTPVISKLYFSGYFGT